jgi:mRNA-degrading endonuclease toxin of MazEF toxin-antitoxin module
MKAFDVYNWQPAGWDKPHPCVIVSHPDRAERKDPVEVLMCSSQRASRKPEVHEMLLDKADGMEWETLCKCDLIHAVLKNELKQRRGTVSMFRRQQLIRTIIAAHGWPEVLAS